MRPGIIDEREPAEGAPGRARWQPLRGVGGVLEWRQMLPLSLSYDHRLINGADAARFTRRFAELLASPSGLVATRFATGLDSGRDYRAPSWN